jgi:hypothetical protein
MTRCLAALIAALAAGCGGPDAAEVGGTVTVKGKAPAVPGLTVTFMGADGRPVTAAVNPDGTYRATGVPAGEVRVGFAVAGDADPDKAAAGSDKPAPGESPEDAQRRVSDPRVAAAAARRAAVSAAVPAKYLDPLRSGVTVTLNPGPDNTFDYDIR